MAGNETHFTEFPDRKILDFDWMHLTDNQPNPRLDGALLLRPCVDCVTCHIALLIFFAGCLGAWSHILFVNTDNCIPSCFARCFQCVLEEKNASAMVQSKNIQEQIMFSRNCPLAALLTRVLRKVSCQLVPHWNEMTPGSKSWKSILVIVCLMMEI